MIRKLQTAETLQYRKTPRIIRKLQLPSSTSLSTENVSVADDTKSHSLVRRNFSYQTPSNSKSFVEMQKPASSTSLQESIEEVESYPCKFCENRIFLTGSRLKAHAEKFHPEALDDVITQIVLTEEEWKERNKNNDRKQLRANLITSKMRKFTQVRIRRCASKHVADKLSRNLIGDRFQPCSTCSMLINVNHPTAISNHLKAHNNNEQLKLLLLEEYGKQTVARLTCQLCQLVFTDEKKLVEHISDQHGYRKKYICRHCGTMLPTLSELYVHKAENHHIEVSTEKDITEAKRKEKTNLQSVSSVVDYQPFIGRQKPNSSNLDYEDIQKAVTSKMPCRTSCDVCGLRMSRPSLLIRHMQTVHLLTKFSCLCQTPSLPPFRISVTGKSIVWACCEINFSNRSLFIAHRRQMHLKPLLQNTSKKGIGLMENQAKRNEVERRDEEEGKREHRPLQAEIVQGPEGPMIVLPEGADLHGEFIVIIDGAEVSVKIGDATEEQLQNLNASSSSTAIYANFDSQ